MRVNSIPETSNGRPHKAIKPATHGIAPSALSTQQVATKPNIISAQRKPIQWSDKLITPTSTVQKLLDAKLKGQSK